MYIWIGKIQEIILRGTLQMNLFEFFTKLNQRQSERGWVRTTATFTGKYEKAAVRTKGGYRQKDYNTYEFRYMTDQGEQSGWHIFYPVPDPDIEELPFIKLNIRYQQRRPYLYEQVADDE